MNGNKVTWFSTVVSSLFLASVCHAADNHDHSETNEALERIEKKIEVISDNTKKANSVFVDQPLGSRTQGIEFNFVRLLTWSEDEKTISGTYSLFNTENNTEIAFPFMYSSAEQDDYNFESSNTGNLDSLTIDAHYRKYLGHRIDGFYISGFARAASLSGLKNDGEQGDEFKLGLGAGIGYRVVSDNGLYWGASLSVGRYLIGESDMFMSSDGISADMDDSEWIVDVELLKFGYAF